jgi:outer membrane protein
LALAGLGFAGITYHKEKKVNSRMLTRTPSWLHTTMIRTAAFAAACLFAAAAASAQGTPAAGSSVSTKLGVIDVRTSIVSTAEGKQASAELQSQFAPRQAELENLNKTVNDLRQRLTTCEGKCSQEEIARLTGQGQRLAAQLERKQTEYQEDVNAAQGEVIDRIGRKLVDVLDRYARENGYVAIFDSSAQNSPILYKSTQIDVTQDIVRLYDQAYPVKAAATTPIQPKPAAKPAAQQQQPPPAQKPQQ